MDIFIYLSVHFRPHAAERDILTLFDPFPVLVVNISLPPGEPYNATCLNAKQSPNFKEDNA